MDNKLDKLMGIVIGLCLIACGLLFVIRDYFTLPFGSIICMMIGFVCVVYYFDRKRVWALAVGMYLFYWGAISGFYINNAYFGNLVVAMFFLAPGLSLDVLYIENRKRYQLMIGSILTCVGLGIVLRPILNIEPVEIMPLVIGIAFVIDYVFSFDYGNRWGLYFGVLMCIYAFKNAIHKGNAMNIAETDEAFHDVIYLGTGNDKLVQILNNLREQMYRYRLEYIKDEDKRQILVVEHEHILAAIKTRNIAEAKNAAREHIDNQEITVSKNIKEQEDVQPVRGRGRR